MWLRKVMPTAAPLAVAAALAAAAVLSGAADAAGADGSGASSSAAAAPSPLDSLLAAPVLDPGVLARAVLERNPSLAAMRAAWSESVARADQAGAPSDPMADVMVAPGALGEGLDAPGYAVGISQEFPFFGRRGLRRDAARAGARVAGEDARALRLDLARAARRLFAEWYVVARGMDVNRELKGLVGQFRRIALAKYAAGTVGEQDALQADVELAMLDHQAVVLQREHRIVRTRLNTLLHRDPSAELPPPPASLPPVGESAVTAAEADSALRRPEVLAAEARESARRAELSLARKDRLPDFTLLAGYDAMWPEQEMRAQVGLSLSLPIWTGRIGASVREASAAVDRAERERLAAIDRVRAEWSEAVARVEETRHEVHIIETMVLPASERLLASTRAGYETNRSDFLSLLNAERDLARARFDHQRALADYQMALADLDRALGRGGSQPTEVTR